MLFAADNFLRTCQKKAATASDIATTSQSCCKVNISKLVQVSPKHDGLIREKLRSPLRLHHRENEVKHVVLTGVTRRPLKCHWLVLQKHLLHQALSFSLPVSPQSFGSWTRVQVLPDSLWSSWFGLGLAELQCIYTRTGFDSSDPMTMCLASLQQTRYQGSARKWQQLKQRRENHASGRG